uniref:50S ribosomal protein S18 n=1 Tax=Gymnochlora stellata TaxID=67809 RepID=A0A140JZG1_GYMST|nr:50S ribosomal protein S18 [Gymnochlora stellata]BAU62488.1 50S ribosomal protein S18 [Gymnochlora stellata]
MNKKDNISVSFSSLNYKNSNLLKKFVRSDGRILPKFITLLTPKSQRKISKTIKTARILGLLKFINN